MGREVGPLVACGESNNWWGVGGVEKLAAPEGPARRLLCGPGERKQGLAW